MFEENFKNFIENMKKIDPQLRESEIRPVLMDMEYKSYNYSIEKWIVEILNDFSMYKSIVREIEFLYYEFKRLEPIFREHRINTVYKNIINGRITSETEIYKRQIIPYTNTEISVSWSVSKAKKVISEDRVQKSYFPFNKMNISFGELEHSYLEKAAKNQTPGILIQYEPYKDTNHEHFLLDGNHRITGKYLNKCRKKLKGINIDYLSPIYIKNSKIEFPVYILKSEESLKSMEHPFFQYFYLIHILYKQMKFYFENGIQIDEIVDNQNSRYNSLKMIVI